MQYHDFVTRSLMFDHPRCRSIITDGVSQFYTPAYLMFKTAGVRWRHVLWLCLSGTLRRSKQRLMTGGRVLPRWRWWPLKVTRCLWHAFPCRQLLVQALHDTGMRWNYLWWLPPSGLDWQWIGVKVLRRRWQRQIVHVILLDVCGKQMMMKIVGRPCWWKRGVTRGRSWGAADWCCREGRVIVQGPNWFKNFISLIW